MIAKNIFVGIPSIDEKINKYLVLFLLNNFSSFGGVCIKSGQPVDCVRNKIVEHFLESDSEWLLFIDDDMIPPYDLLNIVSGRVDDNIKVISPLNYIYRENKITNNIFGKSKIHENGNNYTIEVEGCGCGCCFIHRSVFEKLNKPYFEFVKDDNGYLLRSENLEFNRKCKNIGINCYIDTRYRTNHLKRVGLLDINNIRK